jgi:hypothetical protein
MPRRTFAVVFAIFLVACHSRGGGGDDDDDDSSVPGVAGFIAPYSVCAGAAVDELWEPVFDQRIGALPSELSTVLDCIRSARDCATVLGCVGLDPTATCGAETGEGSCEGSVLVDCENLPNGMDLSRRTDCRDDPYGNTECVVDDYAYATCASGTCEGTPASVCDGDVLVECFGNVEYRLDCGSSDRTCIATESAALCGLPGESCTASSCDGDVHVKCDEYTGVVYDRVACADLLDGATCIDDTDGPRCALPSAEQECDDGDARCEGSTARSCLGGRWFDVDCSTFHDASCASGGEGVFCVADDWP